MTYDDWKCSEPDEVLPCAWCGASLSWRRNARHEATDEDGEPICDDCDREGEHGLARCEVCGEDLEEADLAQGACPDCVREAAGW